MKKLFAIQLILISSAIFIGCQPGQALSDPDTVVILEETAEGAVGLTQLLGLVWPALIPVGTAGAGILAAYKRLKPKIIESQKNSDKYFAGGEALATVLEDIKINEPELWAKIGPKIDELNKPATDIESALRGFRGI